VQHLVTDQQGRVRLGIGISDTRGRIVYRNPDEKDWKTLSQYDAVEGPDFYPLGFDADPDLLFIVTPYRDKAALFRMRLSAPQQPPELVFADPNYDVTGPLIYAPVGDSQRAIGVHYAADTHQLVYWNDTYRQLQSRIDRALPGRLNLIASSADGVHIVWSSGPAHAPVYYEYNLARNTLGAIAETYPDITDKILVEPQTISFKARDGTTIPGYLSLPRDRPGKVLPTIVFPHGGPWARDVKDFDPWTQYFTNRGWAVLQINFRGSAGFGEEFSRAGFQQWGLQMQDDITDGVQWLIHEGIADAKKVCIVGASYGGYAALMGLVKTPELYRCGVSFAPVTDLLQVLEDDPDRRFAHHRLRRARLEKRIGHWWSDRTRLKETSPSRLGDRIHTPLLLVHGKEDRIVGVEHSRKMASALRDAGFKDFEYLELPLADHDLSRQGDRTAFFSAMEVFLKRHLK
jgi:dipeptidyl aminopeptidase/acylaminoacyl peptidase